jgi:hypothetical protein
MSRSLSAFSLLVMVIAGVPLAADCTQATGHFEASIVPPGSTAWCPATAPFCTAGRVWGGMQGDYRFVMSGLLPSTMIGGMPTIFFFAGQSTVDLKDGGQAIGTDTGSIDLNPATGGFASLITFTSGRTGQIRLRGQLGATGTTSGDYTGTLCTP